MHAIMIIIMMMITIVIKIILIKAVITLNNPFQPDGFSTGPSTAFREIYVWYLEEKVYTLWLYYIASSCNNLLWNQKFVINITFTCKHWNNQCRNVLLSEKWISKEYLISSEKKLKFLEISATFIIIGDDMTLCQCILSLTIQMSIFAIALALLPSTIWVPPYLNNFTQLQRLWWPPIMMLQTVASKALSLSSFREIVLQQEAMVNLQIIP